MVGYRHRGLGSSHLAPGAEPLELSAAGPGRLGRFVVLEPLDREGMSAAFVAYDPDLGRKVALEVLPDDPDDQGADDDSPRLWQQAQALARLSHPNVVTVYEVGRSDGVVFVAMELVSGRTLVQWQGGAPGWRAVLDAYVQAGQGLAAAHDAGLVHGGFGPQDVVRTEDGVVKVLDFGLARSVAETGPEPRDSWPASGVTSRRAYASPEQHRGDPGDARSDQYGLCVALWEALTGALPRSVEELREHQPEAPPAWPPGAVRVPRAVVAALQRGLLVDPDERWPTMVALLAELRRALDRRRGRVAWALVGTSMLALGSVTAYDWGRASARPCTGASAKLDGVWDDARRTEVETAMLGVDRAHARRAWEHARAVLDDYAEAWVTMHTEACEATAVRQEQSQRVLDLRMACLHRAMVGLSATAQTLVNADATVVDEAHELVATPPPLARCADVGALEGGVEPPHPSEAEAVDRARRHLAAARSERAAGRYELAHAAVEEAKEALTEVEYGPLRAECALEEGEVLDRLGELDAAATVLGDALRLAARWRDPARAAKAATELMYVVGHRQQRPEVGMRYWPLARGLSGTDRELSAGARSNRGTVFVTQGKYEDAARELRAAREIYEDVLGPEHARVATVRSDLGSVLRNLGQYEEAEAETMAALSSMRSTLGPDHPRIASLRANLGMIFAERGAPEEAEAELRAALAIRSSVFGPDHPDVLSTRNNLGAVLIDAAKLDAAEAEFRVVLGTRRRTLGAGHPKLALTRNNLGTIFSRQGRFEEAEVEYRAVVESWEQSLGADHPHTMLARINLGVVLDSRGAYEDAEREFRAALSAMLGVYGPDHPNVATARINLGLVLRNQEDYDAAEPEYRAALATRERSLGTDHLATAEARQHLASLLRLDGRYDEALPLAELAWRHRQGEHVPPNRRAETAFGLAQILWAVRGPARDRARARTLAQDAVRAYEEAGDGFGARGEVVERWLDDHSAN